MILPFCTSIDKFDRIAQEIGFQLVYTQEFDGRNTWDLEADQKPEMQKLFFEPNRGILLSYCSYNNHADSIRMYFNWRPTKSDWFETIFFSGGHAKVDPDVQIAELEVHEGLRARIRQLDTLGEFVTPWLERPKHLWLANPQEIEAHPIGSSTENTLSQISEAKLQAVSDPTFRSIVFAEKS